MVEDIVILRYDSCKCEFEKLRWQFEIDIEEEGDDYLPCCPSCSGVDDLM